MINITTTIGSTHRGYMMNSAGSLFLITRIFKPKPTNSITEARRQRTVPESIQAVGLVQRAVPETRQVVSPVQ